MIEKVKRIFALLAASIIVIMVVITVVLGAMGSKKFMGMIACDIIVPIFLFSFFLVYNLTVKSRTNQYQQDSDSEDVEEVSDEEKNR